ncbi:MAG: YoeB-like toxin of bacterial type toxin-antitoxin system [Chloroflexota bacterium]
MRSPTAGACRLNLTFSDDAWENYLHWQKQDRKRVEPRNLLIKEVQRDPLVRGQAPLPT